MLHRLPEQQQAHLTCTPPPMRFAFRRHGAAVWCAAGQHPAALPAHSPGKLGVREELLRGCCASSLQPLLPCSRLHFQFARPGAEPPPTRHSACLRSVHPLAQVHLCHATPVLRLASVKMSPNLAGSADAAAAEGSGSAAASAQLAGGAAEEQQAAA